MDDPDQPPQEAAAAVVVPKKEQASERDKKPIPRYHVILWDSDDHSYEYVERMLRELFGHAPEACHQMAETVDRQGRAVVLTTTQEHAELKRDQVHAYGKDELIAGCQGAMKASIEEAP